jgi:hypothetical protein
MQPAVDLCRTSNNVNKITRQPITPIKQIKTEQSPRKIASGCEDEIKRKKELSKAKNQTKYSLHLQLLNEILQESKSEDFFDEGNRANKRFYAN